MKYKIFIILSILFIISISAVSAENPNDQTIGTIDESIMGAADADLLSGDTAGENSEGTFQDLESILWRASDGDTITLDRNYSYDGADRKVMGLYRQVTIEGNGYTLDGKNGARIFYISEDAKSVTFKNINFINANINGAGGAILDDGAGITIINCTFINNRISGTTGGALSINNVNNVLITNSTFIGNYATGVGGAVSITGDNTVLTNNIFTNNKVTDNLGGAVLLLGNYITVKNNTFTENWAGRDGGAIDIEGKGTETRSQGTIVCDNKFYDNTGVFGGGLAMNCKDSEIYNNTFTNNKAIDSKSLSFGGIGGAIRVMGEKNIKLTNNTFIGNTAYRQGGAFYLEGANSIISDNILTNNHAQIDAGGSINLFGNGITVSNNQITTSTAKNSGGAIFLKGNNAVITGNVISKASSTSSYGGAISIYGASATITNNEIADSTAGDLGGGIYISGAKAVINNNNLTNNNGRSGGALFLDSTSATVTNNIFTRNTASVGSTIYGKGASSQITKNTFVGAKKSDGVIKWIDDPQFIGNKYTADPDDGKLETIFVASAVTTVYNGNKNLVFTLKDENGKGVSGVKVTIKFGTKTVTTTTNAYGQGKVTTNAVAPATYNTKLIFAGNAKYTGGTGTVKVVVKKANVKLSAGAKTFKRSVKTKKYTITLKTNQNKVMKNIKVTLKVKGKTYSAKTNSKGQATFKITKLTKKGKFTATVTYGGNKFYAAMTKKPKITVK